MQRSRDLFNAVKGRSNLATDAHTLRIGFDGNAATELTYRQDGIEKPIRVRRENAAVIMVAEKAAAMIIDDGLQV